METKRIVSLLWVIVMMNMAFAPVFLSCSSQPAPTGNPLEPIDWRSVTAEELDSRISDGSLSLDEKEPGGFNVNTRGEERGYTPLLFATQYNTPDVMQRLLDAGADIDAADDTGMTPLIMACYLGDFAKASLLVSAGADVNASTNDGSMTPLGVARMRDRDRIVQLLIENGAM